MAATTLVESDIRVGQEAFEALRDDPVLEPTALAWLYFEDPEEWRYLVATQYASTRGPRDAYLRIRSLLKRAALLERLPLRRVVVTTPDSPFLSALDCVTDVTGSEPRFTEIYNRRFDNGALVDGMLVYRMKVPRKNKPGQKKEPA